MNMLNLQNTMQELIQVLIQNWAMSAGLLIVLTLILINEIQFIKKKGKELSPQEVVNLINHEDAVIVDIRDADTYKKGHIIDAINVRTDDLSQNKIKQYKDKHVVLVCNRGIQAAQLALKLRQDGFSHLVVLAGGMTAWQQAQLPVSKGK